MTKAQCYYEILGVSENATGDEIKKAYKSQALVWHPDKNQANPEEAHAKFQALLKAYETLSDSKERDWYDRHKDLILSDGDKDNIEKCINLFQYFSSACYANFDDEEDGFYTVYRGVFEKISEEENQAIEQARKFSKGKGRNDSVDETFPSFGNSKSAYDDVVKPFYAHWSAFCTRLTFDHLDKYNTTEAENRRIARLMEKENKKVKDAARKERNVNVRNLVEFIRKRDKRLKAHKLLIDQQNELNRQKTLEKQRQQREKSLKESSEYKPSAWLDMDDVEQQLQQLEEEYDDYDLKKNRRNKNRRQIVESDEDQASEAEDDDTNNVPDTSDVAASNASGDQVEESNSDEDEEGEEETYYCPACNKDFRTINAFENHELSKKHKQNVQKLTKQLKADENRLNK